MMARRESRASRDYNRGMEEMRKQMEREMQEREEKLRTAAKIMVLKERETWRSDREQLLDDRRTMQEKLSVTEEQNTKLTSELQEEKDKNRNKGEEIWSLRCQLSTQKAKYDSANALWQRKLHEVLEKTAGAIKKRDEQIISLEQSLHTEKESWQQKVSQLEERLGDKDSEISMANEKRILRTIAQIDTLALLTTTQAALQQSQLACGSLEEELRQRLTEKEEKDQREHSERVENLQKELSERENSLQELSERVESLQKELSQREDSLQKELSVRVESFQKELSEREESLQKELSERVESLQEEFSERVDSLQKELSEREESLQMELSTLDESWERRYHQWEKQKKHLEEMLRAKDEIWTHEEAQRKEEIQRLTDENLQLQELLMIKEKKKNKKSFWSWSRSK